MKKRKPRKPKALLSQQGIIHLNNSFVQPSVESGLLSTVGGGLSQALVLAPNYGYGLHLSDIDKNDDVSSPSNKSDENIPTSTDNGTNGSPSNADNSKKEESKEKSEGKEKTVAQLVRAIGGATDDTPLTRNDIVMEDDKSSDEIENVQESVNEPDPESEEFYASLGMSKLSTDNPTTKTTQPVKTFEVINGQIIYMDSSSTPDGRYKDLQVSKPDSVEDSTQSIADYYKNYCRYYYSVEPNPFGDERLELGHMIEANDVDHHNGDLISEARKAQLKRIKLESSVIGKLKATEKTLKDYALNDDDVYDPLPMEVVPNEASKQLEITPDTTLDQLWEFVHEDVMDFNRWIYLIQYAENSKGDIHNCRKVYGAFLPLFPYCFGYWKRYSELEKTHYYRNRALAILERALEFIPLSADLWFSYISLFSEINGQSLQYESAIRGQYERALKASGKTFVSDNLWEAYIQWETFGKRMKRVVKLYGRLLRIPTRLFNRHWDNFKAILRDYHPRDFLYKEDYEKVRKNACKVLGYRYIEEPEVEPGEIRVTNKPEDKLMDFIKNKIIDRMEIVHKRCEVEVDLRWDFEDKIKRPYFHAKALDNRQLRNWYSYLNFEISTEDHDRIVLLFERCLIACAKYETFWCKYARYLEKYYRAAADPIVSTYIQKSHLNVQIVSEKETQFEEALLEDSKYIINLLIERIEENERTSVDSINNVVHIEISASESVSVNEISSNPPNSVIMNKPTITDLSCLSLSGDSKELPRKSEDTSQLFSFLSIPILPTAEFPWQESVRDVYKRACVVHCSNKPALRLQWAAFEEELGNYQASKELITYVLQWFPKHLDAKIHLLELERRAGNKDELANLFEKFIAAAISKEEVSVISIKYARFLYKEQGNADKALAVLRKALRKDKGNPRLYSYVFEICYERFPQDKKGAAAALELALLSRDLTQTEKLQFLKKKVLFHQEHGDLRKYRDATDELNEIQASMFVEEEAARLKEQQEKWHLLQMQAQALSASVNLQQPFPVPSLSEHRTIDTQQGVVPIQFESLDNSAERSEYTQGEEEMRNEPDPEGVFKKVPPPEEFRISSNYGYGGKHPDFKLAEQMAQKEYEKLESQGYPEDLKDKEGEKLSRLPLKRKNEPLFIVPPRGDFLANYLANVSREDPEGAKKFKLEPPVELSSLSVVGTPPCVNVPDWFIKEGGELCLSESPAGFSMIRYWPHFLSEIGNGKMFKSIRRCIKWHQKQITTRDRLRWIPRLVSWLGPCDYSYSGLTLSKNEDWPPEILDLLHRINQLTNHDFNSCSLNLYRTGHDSNAWHSDTHPGLGSNPPIASVSLGALRTFELKRRSHRMNFIRFPLFPGSLLLMEGATQVDWAHQVPKEPQVKSERINLTFRIMHAYEETKDVPPKNPLSDANTEPLGEKTLPKVIPTVDVKKPVIPASEIPAPTPAPDVVAPLSDTKIRFLKACPEPSSSTKTSANISETPTTPLPVSPCTISSEISTESKRMLAQEEVTNITATKPADSQSSTTAPVEVPSATATMETISQAKVLLANPCFTSTATKTKKKLQKPSPLKNKCKPIKRLTPVKLKPGEEAEIIIID